MQLPTTSSNMYENLKNPYTVSTEILKSKPTHNPKDSLYVDRQIEQCSYEYWITCNPTTPQLYIYGNACEQARVLNRVISLTWQKYIWQPNWHTGE